MANTYNAEYWQKRIPQYLSSDWSHEPSPFARIVKNHLAIGSKILELGTGAGQDGSWFKKQGFEVLLTDGDDAAFEEILARSGGELDLLKVDISQDLPFEDNSFDAVYAQLVLHYFNDETTRAILKEIKRVLKPGGILACMVNSTDDPEYDASAEDGAHLLEVKGLVKRYFTKESFAPFVGDYEPLLFNAEGKTAKDSEANTFGMIQFIGKVR